MRNKLLILLLNLILLGMSSFLLAIIINTPQGYLFTSQNAGLIFGATLFIIILVNLLCIYIFLEGRKNSDSSFIDLWFEVKKKKLRDELERKQ